MDKVKESIRKSFSDPHKYAKVFYIIDKRWTDQLYQSLHAAGNMLNPLTFYDNNEMRLLNVKVMKGFYESVAKLVPEEDEQDQIGLQLSAYTNSEGTFGFSMAIRQRKKKSPVHSKKRNRLTLNHLNDLVFIKYNRTLRRRYNAGNVIDPIALDNIDDANEWLTGVENVEDDAIFEGDSELTFGVVAEAMGVEESRYGLRGNISSQHRRGKEVATSHSLVDEVEEDDKQYNDDGVQDFDNLVEE
ncbi:uncharacterized protein LOC132619807 [Lycium barbarum]|uniref:uncharacterized protein LOC132619807 n=1 Tax=Lycium barbarum TaxID=112863 RepID=UPI00293EF05A|nr:uncharacterized protein LOC132619807 [Lycium barbarum]